MNITLSADEDLIAKARQYAQSRDLTLNQLIRQYMERITGQFDGAQAAEQFARCARQQAGRSDKDFRLRREELHERGSAR